MKYKSNKTITQKLILSIICIMLIINFSIPTYSQALDIANGLFSPIKGLVCGLADTVMHLIQFCFIGGHAGEDITVEGDGGNKDRWGTVLWIAENKVEWPILLITPEEIFKGQIPALDVNFIKPAAKDIATIANERRAEIDKALNSGIQGTELALELEEQKGWDDNQLALSKDSTQSALDSLRTTIASWYMALRNISIIGLLSVLVYVGIRMMLCSVASEKAKYKQMLMDWVVALCLIFFLHYIMSFTMIVVEQITNIFNSSGVSGIKLMQGDSIKVGGVSHEAVSNLMEYARLYVNLADAKQSMIFLIIYVALVFFTVKFIIVYVKRFIQMAFLTMIAPLVALTYPLDKISDGKAQAFNMWLKDYIFNALIQPFHLIIYTVFIGSAMNLAVSNMVYAIVALGFISQAEKFMRKMFGFDKAPSGAGGDLGSFGAGALAGNLISKATSAIGKGGNGGKEKPGADAPKPPKTKIENPYGNGENKDNNSLKSGEDTNLPEGKGEGADKNPVNDFGGANTDEGQNDDLSSPEMQEQLESGDEDGIDTSNMDEGTDSNGIDTSNMDEGTDSDGIDTSNMEDGPEGHELDTNTVDNPPIGAGGTSATEGKKKIGGIRNLGKAVWRASSPGLGKLGKAALKGAVKGAGAAVGAGIGGLTALATGGDISKAMTAGAGAGLAVGNAATKLPKEIKNAVTGIKNTQANFISAYDKDRADEMKYRNNFMNDKAKQDYVRKYFKNAEGGALSGKELKQKMNQLYDYERAGITDIDTQQELMAMEDEKIKNGATVDNARQQVLYANEMASKIDKKQLMEKYDTVRDNQIAQLMENGNYTEQQATHVVDSALKDVGKIKGVSISNIKAQNEKKKAQQKIADQQAATKAQKEQENIDLQNEYYRRQLGK